MPLNYINWEKIMPKPKSAVIGRIFQLLLCAIGHLWALNISNVGVLPMEFYGATVIKRIALSIRVENRHTIEFGKCIIEWSMYDKIDMANVFSTRGLSRYNGGF